MDTSFDSTSDPQELQEKRLETSPVQHPTSAGQSCPNTFHASDTEGEYNGIIPAAAVSELLKQAALRIRDPRSASAYRLVVSFTKQNLTTYLSADGRLMPDPYKCEVFWTVEQGIVALKGAIPLWRPCDLRADFHEISGWYDRRYTAFARLSNQPSQKIEADAILPRQG